MSEKEIFMSTSTLYALIFLGILGLIISLEWNKISRIRVPDPKKIVVILIILFFLGTALASLFR
ncbi:hypothetical protein AKJ62_04430 [candidate division MSBL1 archaeon SCGC-AAA259D14]|uniref:Uncharacterized protein n=2 Tax=candidate division MSBL1 TaxID=215777 RepID=A0A133U3P6_9EURY|nr:hypothetical protein AKJ62_04430 [candidate division MSBL1 archaeon SCGC-AAA259D14]KXA89758.1 hypothetical protein AKJ61_02150 [candidate division MSBL1 archaeon SCGC-AAA259B11]